MNILRRKVHRIKNQPGFTLERDFTFNTFSFLLLIAGIAGTLAVHFAFAPSLQPMQFLGIAACAVGAGIVIGIFSIWSVVVQALLVCWIVMLGVFRIEAPPVYGVFAAVLLLSTSVQLVYHWDKVVVLRLGRFRRVRDAGLFFLIPIVDRAADFVDTRIRVTDFSAEQTLTRDNVPVTIDALCFWMIWDAKRAILELENYLEAVTLSAQTALRDAIGSHDLAVLLSEREEVGARIQKALDAKTNPWGVSILSVEFTDVVIPKELEDAMSRQAQAERERQSRLILSRAEAEIAADFAKAADVYRGDPVALNLRAMNMVYDGIKNNKGTVMLMPSSALEGMNLGALLGTAAFARQGGAPAAPAEKKDQESGHD